MYTSDKINNQRFTIRLCRVAEYFKFKRIGPFEKFLKKKESQVRLVWGFTRTVSIAKLLEEIEEYKETRKNQLT
jgi:hypothetical protein